MTVMSDQPKPHEELQYLNLVRSIIETGAVRPDRTGTGTISLFAPPNIRFSLSKPNSTDPSQPPTLILPLITTKRVFTRGITEELLWFVNGSTNAKLLSDKGVHIWDGNGSREFLDKVGLAHREEGDLGPVYGFQWRHSGAEYKTCHDDYTGQGVDQLAEVIRKIKENPMDRRIIIDAWNPSGPLLSLPPAESFLTNPSSFRPTYPDLPKMALPPCHMFCQFYVTLPTPSSPSQRPLLSCLMYQRSADFGLGVPFNIASYALLTHMIALVTDTIPHELIMQFGDAHVYKDHVEAVKVQLEREPRDFPELKWARSKEEIAGIDGFKIEDFGLVGYNPHPKIAMDMSV
ncbi:thymidylate synthase, partial [Phenoliferia sp. Uapishka_3]